MFGIDDWEFLAKDNSLNGVDEGANPLGLVLTGGALKGMWSISASAFDLYDSLMLVVKGANPNNYVGYLLDSVSGTYTTVFFKTNSKGKVSSQDISHVSLYGVVAAVPVPAAGLLLLGALGGLAALRRRRAAV